MVMRLLPRLVVLSTAVCALATAAPASAQEFVRTDERGDLSRVGEDSDVFVPVPGRGYPDITRVRFAHRDRTVVVRATFVELNPTGKFLFGGIDVRTPRSRKFFTVMATEGSREGFLFKDNEHPCRVGIRISYADELMRVSIPRSCLGDPRWVRVRFGASVLQHDGDEIIDNAGAPRFDSRAPFPWSPRLRRG